MPQLGVPELLIILVIVIVVFGVGKLPQIGGAIGQSIREFRSATKDPNKDNKDDADKPSNRTAATKTEPEPTESKD
jgi:sec-independent protein translocase protein TatA